LMLVAAVSVGIGIPYIYFGGVGPMFTALIHSKPSHFVMPGATSNLGHGWYISTVLLTGLGVYMWPHSFGAAFSAKSAGTLRRNAVIMPLYTLSLAFMLFVGFAAILVIPDLRDGDLSLLAMVRKTFPPWFLGIIGGAGALTAMVPAAILILSSATVFAKNLYRPLFAPHMNDHQVGRIARLMVVVISLISLYLAIHGSSTLVSLLLLGYAGITQLFPGVVLGLFWKRTTTPAVFTGVIFGVASMATLFLTHHDPFLGISAGFLGLCANFTIAISLSLLSPNPAWREL
jgi:SSS family solute:Na+ symporter